MNLSVKILKVLKSVGIALFLITLSGSILDQVITMKMEAQLSSHSGAGASLWFFGAAALVTNLLYPLFFMLTAIAGLSEQSVSGLLKKSANQAIIEEMRAWGKAMLWSLFLIIPGIIQFIRLIFVSFVVTLDPEYDKGSIDALEKSKEIARGKWGRIFALFVMFSVFVPALMTSFDEYKLLWKTPLSALFICFVEMILNLCFILGLWKLYHLGSLQAPKENL